MDSSKTSNLNVIKDCVAYWVIQASLAQKNTKGNAQETVKADEKTDLAAELDDFAQYLSQEVFESLPQDLKYADNGNPEAQKEYTKGELEAIPAPPSFCESLVTYSLANSQDNAEDAFHRILISLNDELVSIADEAKRAALPPAGGWKSTRTDACEICSREVPLTYHHLIPRSTHDKVLRRKWHSPDMLNVVAWLCRPCHNAVHKFAPNEELAQHFYSVDLLMQQEPIQKWAAYAGRQRWGVRRG
ncbi:hypothetical protein CPB86DRAFT_789097 [Serendipita vermifera]|nr:hypothetical protein CPB86DRAFT_789097 [Serendipita vermifera]